MKPESPRMNLALALSGASGARYFLRMLERLRPRTDVSVHLLATDGGKRVLQEEEGLVWSDLDTTGFQVHQNKNIGACLASGSFPLHALVVLPSSMNTVSAIAAGLADSLVQRCAAVQLKEGRRLILVVRETPLSLVNLRAMTAVREAGAVVMPASPGFYHRPQTIVDMLDSIVDRVLDQVGLADAGIKRWNP